MRTTAIHVSSELYQQAAAYARLHHTSVEKMMESYIMSLYLPHHNKPKGARRRQLSPIIERLGSLNL